MKLESSNFTKAGIGLGNVDNTSDLNKPISTATQSALNLKANISDLDNGKFNFILSTPVTYTGSLQEVEVLRLEIPPYTFSENDMLKMPTLLVQKVGIVNGYTIRVKLSTSPTMPALAVDLIAQYNPPSSTTNVNMSRTWFLSGGILRGLGTSNTIVDSIPSTAQLNVPFNNAVTNYLYISIDSAGIQDTQTLVGFQLTNR